MGRKIVFEVVQPIYDADGNLIANVGEQISEAAYDKIAGQVAPGCYRPTIVEEPDAAPEPAPEPEPAPAAAAKAEPVAASKPPAKATPPSASKK